MGASTGYRIIMFQDLLFRYIRPGDGKNAACGLKIIFFGGGIFCRYEYLNFKCKIFNILWFLICFFIEKTVLKSCLS